MIDYKIYDYDGREIKVGSRVRPFDYDPTHRCWPAHDMCYGTVTEITEWEGDCDYEGRSITIPPIVLVEFDDKNFMEYQTSEWEWEFDGGIDEWGDSYGGEYPVAGKVEELSVIGPPDVGYCHLGHGPVTDRLLFLKAIRINRPGPMRAYAMMCAESFAMTHPPYRK